MMLFFTCSINKDYQEQDRNCLRNGKEKGIVLIDMWIIHAHVDVRNISWRFR